MNKIKWKSFLLVLTIICLGLPGCKKQDTVESKEIVISSAESEKEEENKETYSDQHKDDGESKQEENTQKEEEHITWGEDPLDVQFELIESNTNTWVGDPEYANDLYDYTVTDLDHNGRLEIIVCNMGGTGVYSYSRIYEVNENLDGIYECDWKWDEEGSQPDLIITDWSVYIDESGKYYYVVGDDMKNGSAETHQFTWAIHLENGKFDSKVIASSHLLGHANGNGYDLAYEDAGGNGISETDFLKAADAYFDGYKKEILTFNWKDMHELSDDEQTLRQQIKSAYYGE